MKEPRSTRSRTGTGRRRCGLRPTLLLGLTGLLLTLLTLLAPPVAALAHPLDVYLQATYITVAPAQIVVELDLSPGVLVAPQVIPQLDSNGDRQISDAEGQAYVDAMLRNVVLQVDGKQQTPAVTKIDMPPCLTVQAGYGTIRIFTTATLADGMQGTHTIYYRNNYAPTGSSYQVNAFVDKGVAITLGKQNRDSIQQSMTVDYIIGQGGQGGQGAGSTVSGGATAEAAGSAAQATAVTVTATGAVTGTAAATTGTVSLNSVIGTTTGASDQVRQLLGYLSEPALTPWVLLVALGLAGLLGGLHALTPGHGKTLVAAYLVGSRGTVRHAVALGAIVTFTHTSSVIVIGLLALFASQYVVPNVLVPALEIVSGLLVVFMGARLVWQRWSTFRNRRNTDHDHDHAHDHDPGHTHRHDHDHTGDHTQPHTHDHGDGHAHSHLPPAEGIKPSSLLAMGVSGGLVPCPEALGLMVIAVGLNRIMLGLGLIVAFSLGLAAVLITLGILLVRFRSVVGRMDRMGKAGRITQRVLPLASAVIVTALGVGIAVQGLLAYLVRS